MGLISIARFGPCQDYEADLALERWGHWLGGNSRPFGRCNYGMWWDDELVSVAVSASTVNRKCGGFDRDEVVELVRLCSRPDHRDLTRVMLRLWRKAAPADWSRYWTARAMVSYANSTRHKGDIYRFDGWVKLKDLPGGVGWGGHQEGVAFDPKSLWVYMVDPGEHEALRKRVAADQKATEAKAEKRRKKTDSLPVLEMGRMGADAHHPDE